MSKEQNSKSVSLNSLWGEKEKKGCQERFNGQMCFVFCFVFSQVGPFPLLKAKC